jgi:plasmid stabilization system protein ParE
MVAGTTIADSYTNAIAEFCHSLITFPQRGLRRDDLRPGLRVTNYRKRVVIAFAVDVDIKKVMILAIFHGGQDYEAALSGPGP